VVRFAVRRLADVLRIPVEADDPEWYPLQHHFGLTAFGANVYVTRADGTAVRQGPPSDRGRHA